MKKLYKFILLVAIVASVSHLSAQRVVVIEPSADPAVPTDIFPIIMGDTTDTGERMDNNTIYKLKNGNVYIVTDRLVNKPEWKLHIEAEDLDNTDLKPVISRIPNASGSYPKVIYSEGDLTLKNVWLITGEKGPLESGDWGQIRLLGGHTTTIVDNCIIEKDRGGILQVRADSVKI